MQLSKAASRVLELMWDAAASGKLNIPRHIDTPEEVLQLALTAISRDGARCVPLELARDALDRTCDVVPMDGSPIKLQEPPKLILPEATHSRAVLSIGVGEKCAAELAISRGTFQRYASEIGAQYVELTDLPPLNHGCAYKYALSQVARNYQQTLLLDTDVIVMPSAENIFDAVPVGSWGLSDDLLNLQQSGCTAWLVAEFNALADSLGAPRQQLVRAWNSGVVVAPTDAFREYYAPPLPVPATWCAEQHWHTYCLLEAREKQPNRVVDLDSKWQAGFPWDSFPAAVQSSHFIHINGCHGPHAVRLAFMRHFATGNRHVSSELRSLFDGSFNPPWWILHGL